MNLFGWLLTLSGHVDRGEQLFESAIREMREETGLAICDLQSFAMWESCYPTYLDQGRT